MIKVNVFNMDEFLQTVNECTGAIKVVYPDGRKQDINKNRERQLELRSRHSDNHQCLGLTLEIPNPKDYLKIIYFTIGDC